jgi:hypothetical protein
MIEQRKNGGRIVFGSMGFKREDGSVHWEYGGEDWVTVQDFKVRSLDPEQLQPPPQSDTGVIMLTGSAEEQTEQLQVVEQHLRTVGVNYKILFRK